MGGLSYDRIRFDKQRIIQCLQYRVLFYQVCVITGQAYQGKRVGKKFAERIEKNIRAHPLWHEDRHGLMVHFAPRDRYLEATIWTRGTKEKVQPSITLPDRGENLSHLWLDTWQDKLETHRQEMAEEQASLEGLAQAIEDYNSAYEALKNARRRLSPQKMMRGLPLLEYWDPQRD